MMVHSSDPHKHSKGRDAFYSVAWNKKKNSEWTEPPQNKTGGQWLQSITDAVWLTDDLWEM